MNKPTTLRPENGAAWQDLRKSWISYLFSDPHISQLVSGSKGFQKEKFLFVFSPFPVDIFLTIVQRSTCFLDITACHNKTHNLEEENVSEALLRNNRMIH